MGPTNAVMGNDSYGTELPRAQVDPEQLAIEQRMAKYSKSDEFKKLKEHLEGRINFFQQHLPNGASIEDLPIEEIGPRWIAANIVIKELKSIIGAYENARDSVDA